MTQKSPFLKRKNIDIEKCLLSSLVTTLNKTEQEHCIRSIDSGEFFTYPDVADFVWEFWNKHGSAPTKQVIEDEFPNFSFTSPKEPFSYFVRTLRERTLKKQINRHIGQIFKAVDGGANAFSVADQIRNLADMLKTEPTQSEGVFNWADPEGKLKRYKDRAEDKVLSFRFPLASLRVLVDRMYAEEILTIVALPGIGKTWVGCYFAYAAAVEQGRRVLIVSREISGDDIKDRLDGIHARLNWTRFRRGKLRLREFVRYRKAITEIDKISPNVRIVGSHTYEFTLDDLHKNMKDFQAEIVIVDGMHLIGAPGKTVTEQTYARSRAFKSMCQACSCVGIQTIHAKAEQEPEEGKKMKRAGLGRANWGAAASQDSDYYAELLAPSGRESPERVFAVEKARNDKTGDATFFINLNPVRFTDAVTDHTHVFISPIDG